MKKNIIAFLKLVRLQFIAGEAPLSVYLAVGMTTLIVFGRLIVSLVIPAKYSNDFGFGDYLSFSLLFGALFFICVIALHYVFKHHVRPVFSWFYKAWNDAKEQTDYIIQKKNSMEIINGDDIDHEKYKKLIETGSVEIKKDVM